MHLPSLNDFSLEDTLRLIRSEQIGPRTFFDLIRLYRSPAAALRQVEKLAAVGKLRKGTRLASPSEISREIKATQRIGGQFILYGSPKYPALLLTISDPPPVLIALGRTELLSNDTILAIVGARNASNNGCRYAALLAEQLSTQGYPIVSGLARGIDAGAHSGALKHGTVGVIAGGINTMYPPENRELYHAMRDHGCIISEQPIDQQPFARAFPARNRIIAGMAQATMVVEATLRSGSLITARLASEMGRDVFAVPGFPMDPRCKGTNKLLKDGAHVLASAEDVIDNLNSQSHFTLKESWPNSTDSYDEDRLRDIPSDSPEISSEHASTGLPSILLEQLGATPVLVDELLESCQVTPREALATLLELELSGDIQRLPGNRICRVFAEEVF